MVANVRCEDIKNEQLAAFSADQAWTALAAEAQAGAVRDFGARAAGLKDSCLDGCGARTACAWAWAPCSTVPCFAARHSAAAPQQRCLAVWSCPPPPHPTPRYDQEAMYFHSAVREAKRAELLEGLGEALAGAFDAQARHLVDREMVRGARRGACGYLGPAVSWRLGQRLGVSRCPPPLAWHASVPWLPHTRAQVEFDRSFRLGLSEGRAGGFSGCARECEAEALSRFDAALGDVLIPGVPQLDGAARMSWCMAWVAAWGWLQAGQPSSSAPPLPAR